MLTRRPKTAADPNAVVPGPSPDPATNLMMTELALRVGSHLVRNLAQRRLLGPRYGTADAKKILANRTMKQTAASMLVSRIATRSVPGAVLVGTGLLAKTLFDRSQKRRKAQRAGDRALLDQANGD